MTDGGKPVPEIDSLIGDPWQPLIAPTQWQRRMP